MDQNGENIIYGDDPAVKKVKIGQRAFEKLSQILDGCSIHYKDCKSCPLLPKCLLLWDRFVVNCVDDSLIGSKKEDSDDIIV